MPFDNEERVRKRDNCYGLRRVATSTIMSLINKFSGKQEWKSGKKREIGARPPKYKYFRVRTFSTSWGTSLAPLWNCVSTQVKHKLVWTTEKKREKELLWFC